MSVFKNYFYDYTYQRPQGKRYNYMDANNVQYSFGTSGRSRGRLEYVMDGTGTRRFDYDALGNVTKEIRTVTIPGDDRAYTFASTYDYDSWGRMICMTYPDGERVKYHYNAAGELDSMDWTKGAMSDIYIGQILYNKYGNRTFIKYGNNTYTNYHYDQLQRLNRLQSRDHNNNLMQDIVYNLDKVGNIGYMVNHTSPIGTLGGQYKNTYRYDNIYRLILADGNGDCGGWNNKMEYTDGGRIRWKQEHANSAINNGTSILNYGYCDTYQPHAPRRIKDTENNDLFDLQWDEAGNLSQRNHAKVDGFWLGSRHLFWTEDNRMHAVIDADFYSYYTYDYSGERTLKLVGSNNEMDVNAEFQHTAAVLDQPTLYPSPYVVMGLHGYTKHYYAGTERICAKIGGGFDGHLSENRPDLQETANRLFAQSRDDIHHRELPQNDLNCIVSYGHIPDEELSVPLHEMPKHLYAEAAIDLEWFHHVVDLCEHESEEENKIFFYHSDHLGSASWITNKTGDAIQHLQYLPFGAPFVNQHAPGAGYSERYRFTGKERDEETGYGYFGARYMDHELMTMWLSVDPMMEMSPNMSPYHYCHWNPIKLTDPTGMLDDEWQLNIRTNELTWVSGKGGALHQTITCITPDGSSFVQQMDGMLLRAESRWYGGNNYEVNLEAGDYPQLSPRLTQPDGICVSLNSNQPSPSIATLTGSIFLSAASAVNNLTTDVAVGNYIKNYTSYCRTKFNRPNGRLSNAKIAELTSDYNSLRTFGKIGKWGGGFLSVVGVASELSYAIDHRRSTGAWIRFGLSSGVAAAGIFCSGPAAPFVAAGVLLWGIFDAFWGDDTFNF